jgi:hypothetical protein
MSYEQRKGMGTASNIDCECFEREKGGAIEARYDCGWISCGNSQFFPVTRPRTGQRPRTNLV